MCANHHISVLPLSLPSVRKRVEDFLAANGLRLDPVDCYVAITRSEDSDAILAGGGLSGNVIKCVAVSDEARSEGLTNKLISQLISIAGEKGYRRFKIISIPSVTSGRRSRFFPKPVISEMKRGMPSVFFSRSQT